MWGSAVVYTGAVLVVMGLGFAVRPSRRLRVPTRARAFVVTVVGLILAAIGLTLPAYEFRVERVETRLDEFGPAWQFREVHQIRIAAPPAVVFEAIQRLRADEIFLFRTLTWIRRGGRTAPRSILNPGDATPLIDVATSTGFVSLAVDEPRELVIGAMVVAPPGPRFRLTSDTYRKPQPPGTALATMNFFVTPDGPHGSIVSTETRVHANDARSRRLFAGYWRIIYPGSALIRRMWLRAIDRRARAGTLNQGQSLLSVPVPFGASQSVRFAVGTCGSGALPDVTGGRTQNLPGEYADMSSFSGLDCPT